MENKLKSFFLALCLFASSYFGIFDVSADVQTSANLRNEMIDFKLTEGNYGSVEEWIENGLSAEPESSSWYLIGLSQMGNYDFSSYEQSLADFLASNTIRSASTRQKYALVLAACGSNDGYIFQTLEDSVGEQGVMSWIFGLHILNNGFVSENHTAESAKNKLLSLRLSDGGWAVSGNVSDVDVTAMAVQALAPFYVSCDETKSAVDGALNLLSERQLENGGFKSYGKENSESVSQVIIALSSLGIDCETEERFIKNGKTLIDVLWDYCLENGGFSHVRDGEYNEIATSEAFLAMVAHLRLKEGEPSIWIFDRKNPISKEENSETLSQKEPVEQKTKLGFEFWAGLVVVVLAVVACVVILVLKKNKSNLWVVLFLTLAALVLLSNVQTVEEYNNSNIAKEKPIGTVTISIRCDKISGKTSSENIPFDGLILSETEVEIEEGETVFDVLSQCSQKFNIPVDNSGSKKRAYISGINSLYEFDFGDLSGWVYRVNGEIPSVGCGEFVLSPGDEIEWIYSLDLGRDLE